MPKLSGLQFLDLFANIHPEEQIGIVVPDFDDTLKPDEDRSCDYPSQSTNLAVGVVPLEDTDDPAKILGTVDGAPCLNKKRSFSSNLRRRRFLTIQVPLILAPSDLSSPICSKL